MLRKRISQVAVAALLASSTMAHAEDSPAYLVASLKVTDLNAYFETYGGPVFPMLDAAGAEVLVGSPSVNTLEGEYAATWTAIVRFPSMQALNDWYASAEYQAIAPARRALSDEAASTLISAPAFVVPAQ